MGHNAKRLLVFVATVWLPFSACSNREMIPASELKEIRQLAFDGATKRYVRSDASIESEYQKTSVITSKRRTNRKRTPPQMSQHSISRPPQGEGTG